jgi:hypothetical protein
MPINNLRHAPVAEDTDVYDARQRRQFFGVAPLPSGLGASDGSRRAEVRQTCGLANMDQLYAVLADLATQKTPNTDVSRRRPQDFDLRYNSTSSPAGWNEVMPGRRQQNFLQHCGSDLGDVLSLQHYQNAPVDRQSNQFTNPTGSHGAITQQMPSRWPTTPQMTQQHVGRKVLDLPRPVDIRNMSPSQAESFQETSQISTQLTMPGQEVGPCDNHVPIDRWPVSKNDTVDADFKHGFCLAMYRHGLGTSSHQNYSAAQELQRSIPTMQMTSNMQWLASNPDEFASPKEVIEDVHDSSDRSRSDRDDNADVIFQRGIALLLPSFFGGELRAD